MMNVCRHRSMQLVPDGCGSARRFTCLYHAWSYGIDGRLLGVQAEDTFGAVDRDEFSLLRLECGERAGLMFVGLTPGVAFDIDEWLVTCCPNWRRSVLRTPSPSARATWRARTGR
jgi:phenylpropionate dioxygenase-like ring-hydroxylating dioxygenase large terminal subunit